MAAAQKLVTNALRWRKEYGTDAIGSSDDFGGWPSDLLAGSDGDGRPLVLVRLGALPESAFADVDRFVRWRVAELEKAIRQLGLFLSVIQVPDCPGRPAASATEASWTGRRGVSGRATRSRCELVCVDTLGL